MNLVYEYLTHPHTGTVHLTEQGDPNVEPISLCGIGSERLIQGDETVSGFGATCEICKRIMMSHRSPRLTPAERTAVDAAIMRAKAEILIDQAAGRFRYRNDAKDGTINTFADLHDYVDANEYGGLCEPEKYPEFWTTDGYPSIDASNAVQDGLDVWIRTGGLSGSGADVDEDVLMLCPIHGACHLPGSFQCDRWTDEGRTIERNT